MATLLFGVLVASTWASYRGVKDSATEVGRERLVNLTQQLAGLMQQSASNVSNKTFAAANDPAIRTFLHSSSPATRSAAMVVLQQFTAKQDPTSLQVELWSASNSLVLILPDGSSPQSSNLQADFERCAAESFKMVGAIRPLKDNVGYPVIAAVKDDAGRPIAYLVRWRKLSSTPEARKQLTDLIGSDAALYFGNSQGDVWTDLVKIVPKPPVSLGSTVQMTNYTRDGNSVMALGRPISGTPWFVTVEFPDRVFLTQANRFLRRMIFIGLILFTIGVGSAFVLSRSITRPLHSLREAATAISGGDYSRSVRITSHDELGELAAAFNTMVGRVRDSQQGLEQKIQQRTLQLALANQELDSFSYSVSHDLRAPLRAIDGFSRILVDDHSSRLDADAARVLGIIRSNTQNMGRLIDDLLAFSRLGRKPIERSQIDMKELVRDAFTQISSPDSAQAPGLELGPLDVAHGDPAMLRQVFVNLLSNAAKYSRAKQPALIEVGGYGENGENVYYVKDNGVGFDMTYADKLFGVFQRLHSAEEFEGTGVGLAIVQRIIQRHGGRVWADGKVNEGATFYFTLPKEQQRDGKLAKHE